MRLTTSIFTASLCAISSAHSWVHCTAHDNHEILEWMKSNATKHGKDHVIDPLMPWFADLCKGWPRSKQNPGDWIDESTYYIWDIQGAIAKKDTHACHPDQRSPTYHTAGSTTSLKFHKNPAPMATAKAGDSIKLMFGGNGHSRGANAGGNGDAGRVGVYWAGKPETDIVDVKELNADNLVQENGFSEESFAFPDDPKVQSPEQGLIDKGNWQTLKLPECMEKGRHMMVWVWSWKDMPRFSTCFDVMIE